MTKETQPTPQQMLEWLDAQMGIEQSKAPWTDRTKEHDVTFYRLKAIYDFIKLHSQLNPVMRSAESWAQEWANKPIEADDSPDEVYSFIHAIQTDAIASVSRQVAQRDAVIAKMEGALANFLVRDESVFSQAMKIGYAQDVLAAAQKLRKNVK